MSFRFRRSVRLVPGLRLNFGLHGASVSLGGHGATLNFSQRGARATFGLPGTGMSWSRWLDRPAPSGGGAPPAAHVPGTAIRNFDELNEVVGSGGTVVYSNSGRRLSYQQLDAARRRLEQDRARQLASKQVAEDEEHQKAMLNGWRDMPALPTADQYLAACATRSFEYEEQGEEGQSATLELIIATIQVILREEKWPPRIIREFLKTASARWLRR